MQHSNPDAMDEAMSRTRADERYRHIVAVVHPRGYGHDMSAAAGNGPPRFVLM
jgi:hypothetical protein